MVPSSKGLTVTRTSTCLCAAWARQILAVLYERRHATRKEIAKQTRLNPASVSQTIRKLMEMGIIQFNRRLASSGGRKPEQLKLNPDAGYFLALDLEGSRLRFGLTNLVGDVRHRWEHPVIWGRRVDGSVLRKGLLNLLANLDAAERNRVLALGVSYTGIMDGEGKVLAVNLGWEDFPLREKIREAVDLPAFFCSESLAKLMAERWLGAAKGRQNCIFVTVANGVGCASMVGGHPVMGCDGAAGELGHVIIDPCATDRCNCGRQGCLEAIVSSPNLVRQYLEKTGKRRSRVVAERVIEVFERAREGEPAAVEVIERAARFLGLGLANLVNVLNPELIVLGGDLIHAEDLFLPRLVRELSKNVHPLLMKSLEIKSSTLGADIGLLGAASVAFHGVLRERELLEKLCSALSVEKIPAV